MRVRFGEIFQVEANGQAITPKVPVRIGSATFTGTIGLGSRVGGADLFAIVGHDLDVECDGDAVVLKGHW